MTKKRPVLSPALEDIYSFCELATAGPLARWHIRKLGPAGRKLGGGADTLALCGQVPAWDLSDKCRIKAHLDHACLRCVAAFRKENP